MKLDKSDVYERFQHFKKQDFSIAECCQDLINQRPFFNHPFYIFAHTRTDEDGVTKRLIWQPRLTKPKAQTNSMLFKAYPGTDLIKVIWMIPAREMWDQYQKGNLTENKTVSESIYDFVHNKAKLEAKEDDDLPDWEVDAIYREISKQAQKSRVVDEKVKEISKKAAMMKKEFIDG